MTALLIPLVKETMVGKEVAAIDPTFAFAPVTTQCPGIQHLEHYVIDLTERFRGAAKPMVVSPSSQSRIEEPFQFVY